MKKLFLISLYSLAIVICYANSIIEYKSLDTRDPIIFGGDHIIYKDTKIFLGPRSFFIDGQLSNELVSKYSYVFNSINEAVKHLVDGTENDPMILNIAPYVYWIDDPDDTEIRLPKNVGESPYGLEIECEWLRFYGLTESAENVVLACNRGQTMGSKGNFTMFNIVGNGTNAENITFGNYCNVDLIYPLYPKFNRKKRGNAIVQAQLAFCRGDKIVARNTRFISRLNLIPFYGGRRTLFDRCHFESTDDALAPKGLYLNCTFDFYSSKPFGHTSGTGAVLLNCDIQSFSRDEQYLVKGSGPIAAVDCRMESEFVDYWGWKEQPAEESKNYHYHNRLNGIPISIGEKHPHASVDMTNKRILDAYRFIHKDQIVYNIYNLLRGDDDWDPMHMKELILDAEKANGKSYKNIPTQLILLPTQDTIETGKEAIVLETQVNRFGDYELKDQIISWEVAPEYKSLIDLRDNMDGTCEVIAINKNDETAKVTVKALTSSGLEATCVLYVKPTFLDAPEFIMLPVIQKNNNGQLQVKYKLDMPFKDQSLVSWYRCKDADGNDPIEIIVSRNNVPKLDYTLTSGDIGYFIMVKVEPKHIRCSAGSAVKSITKIPIIAEDIKKDDSLLYVDFESMSSKYQPEVIPGFWTLDSYAPSDTHYYDWEADNSIDPWYYGNGVNGAANDTGFVQASKGARLRYTPLRKQYDDMKISFTAVPAKTAGQGFSSARAQYLDICLKFDTERLNGYGVRVIRTTKYHDAVDIILIKYENGNAVMISDPVSTSCFRPNCEITIEVIGKKLIVHAENKTDYYIVPNRPEVLSVVDMETEIIPNSFGGIMFQHTGTIRSGATLIKDLKIEW